jgi:hypothetical protein
MGISLATILTSLSIQIAEYQSTDLPVFDTVAECQAIITQDFLDQVSEESGAYEIQVDEYCNL